MNAQELSRNPQLTQWFVRNLNKEPDGWALEDRSVDAVVCCVSVQYLQQPERVLAEVYRVLKPGGVVIITFSNRMFYTKAVAAWRENTDFGRVQLVKTYLGAVRGFTEAEVVRRVDLGGAPRQQQNPVEALLRKIFQAAGKDPFFGIVSYRNFKPGSA